MHELFEGRIPQLRISRRVKITGAYPYNFLYHYYYFFRYKYNRIKGRVGSFMNNKTPAQAFTPPADEKKMGTIWIFVYYAVYGSGRGRYTDFLVLKWGGGGS